MKLHETYRIKPFVAGDYTWTPEVFDDIQIMLWVFDLDRQMQTVYELEYGVREYQSPNGLAHSNPATGAYSIWLSKESLTVEILLHECTHIAYEIWRQYMTPSLIRGRASNHQDEALAVIVSQLFQESYLRLLHHGYTIDNGGAAITPRRRREFYKRQAARGV